MIQNAVTLCICPRTPSFEPSRRERWAGYVSVRGGSEATA
jgi:hypothetical protein